MDLNKKVAEVIEANSSEFVAQCYKLNEAPSLGALVKIKTGKNEASFGVIYTIETHGMEPGRRVFIRGDSSESEEEIFKNNPQIEKLLVTDFKSLVIGYASNENLYQYLPPKPPPIHSFVYICHDDEVVKFSRSLNFLSLLVDAKLSVSADELIAACLRYISSYYADPREFLFRAGRELVWMMAGDIRRLNTILKRFNLDGQN